MNQVLPRLPNISFVLEGVSLTLTPLDYFELVHSWSGNEYYCFGIYDGGENSITILGDVFMKPFYVIFDRVNTRVGFVGRPGMVNRKKIMRMNVNIFLAVPIIAASHAWIWIYAAMAVVSLVVVGTLVYATVMFVFFIRKRRGIHKYQALPQDQDSQFELSM
jgi:hypothetical protein